MLTLLALVLLLRIWRTDLRVPFFYWGDLLVQLAVAKNIALGGWIWFVDRLGAPFGLAISAFPQNLTTTSAFLKLLSVFTTEPGLLVNLYWMLTVVATSVNAHIALRAMGYRASTAVVPATLYALLPYAFYRNAAHLPLVYTFIPVLAAYAVQIAASTAGPLRSRFGAYVIVCAFAQAFDYIYYTFFAVFVFIVAGSLALLHQRSALQARRALALCAILIAAAAVNLAPSIAEWQAHGKPPNTGYKYPAEAEILGLKLRQMLSPVQPSRFAAIRAFGEREQQFPLENENVSTRLGTVLSLALVAFVAHCLFRRDLDPQVRAAAALAFASFLLATVGGLGALFNLVVTPDIRAYNRIVVFIAFFILVYLGWLFDRFALRAAKLPSARARALPGVALAACLLVGLLDQGQAAQPIVDRYASDGASFRAERSFVAEIERRYPGGGAVMQLPETTFPPDGGRERMLPYDHARAYLASTKMSWSWPSFSLRRESWYRSLGDPGDPAFLHRLALSGFVGIWVDRYGYAPADLAPLEATLTARLGTPVVGGLGQRYAFYDLSHVESTRHPSGSLYTADADERYRLLNPLLMSFGDGFYDEEQDAHNTHHWSQRKAVLRISASGDRPRQAVFRAVVQAGRAGALTMAVDGRRLPDVVLAAGEFRSLSIALAVPAGGAAEVDFGFTGGALAAAGDSRALYFAVIDPRVDER